MKIAGKLWNGPDSPTALNTMPTKHEWVGLIASGILYYLAARAGMTLFSLQPANITLIWLPSGIGLVMVLTWGLKAVPFIVLPDFWANFPGLLEGHSLSGAVFHTSISTIADTLAPVLAAQLMGRFMKAGVRDAKDLVWFLVYGCTIPVGLSSILLSLNLLSGHYIESAAIFDFIKMLFFADCLGILLVYQIYIGWPDAKKLVWRPYQMLVGFGFLLAFILMAGASTKQWWTYYLILPTLVIAAFEINLFYIATLSSISMLAVILSTAHGLGPFVADDPQEANAEMMAYVISAVLTIFGLSLQNSQLHRTEKDKRKAEQDAQHDPMTEILNRRAFMPLLQQSYDHAQAHGSTYSVAILDLDDFKSINDCYGHAAGDMVIQQMARTIQQHCPEDGYAARIGGEEFAMLLPNTPATEAYQRMEQIRADFMHTPTRCDDGRLIAATVSIGVACYQGQLGANQVLSEADAALYRAKGSGRNQVLCSCTLE